MTTTSPMEKTFAIPEIFDGILSNTSQQDLLRSLRVSISFRGAITSSTTLRKILMFDQGGDAHDDFENAINPILRPYVTKSQYIEGQYSHYNLLQDAPNFTFNYKHGEQMARMTIYEGQLHDKRWGEHSWAKMYLVQEAVPIKVDIIGPVQQGSDMYASQRAVITVTNAPLGKIFDVAAALDEAMRQGKDLPEVDVGGPLHRRHGMWEPALWEFRCDGATSEMGFCRLY